MTTKTPVGPTGVGAASRRRTAPVHWDLLAAVGVGGTLGTLARYETALALGTATGGFPWATFVVNVTGALLLGAVTTLVLERWPPTRYMRPLIGIGFCGGLTTFSTWMVETVQLVDTRHTTTAIIYVVATLLGGLLALLVGVVAARTLAREGAPS